MNASFSILQKLKNQFFQSVQNKGDYHVAFAPFAFTLSNDDFYFLKNNILTGSEAKKYLKEQSEFSYIANSVLKKPHIWTIDSDNLLFNSYKSILETALIIDPDVLTKNENDKINKAKIVLFKKNGSDSVKYTKYKTYAAKYSEIEKKIIDLNVLKNTISPSDIMALEKWNIDFLDLTNQKKELLIEWQVKGFKSAIESAKTIFGNIILSKNAFLEKWIDAKNSKLAAPNLLTDEYGIEFLSTTCIPNSICDYQSPIWKKLAISKQEIVQLAQSFMQEVPSEILLEFGNLETELDGITFEYCIIDILRPWFDESIINNKFWKYADNGIKVSEGDDTMTGQIPAYPVKIILSKNIDLVFTPNAPVNEEIKNKLKNGIRLFFGSLLLKTIPLNLANDKISTFKVQQLSTNELSVLTSVAIQNTASTRKINEASKFRMVELLNNQPQLALKKNVELKSIRPINLTPVNTISSVNPTLNNTTAPLRNITRPNVMPIRNLNAIHDDPVKLNLGTNTRFMVVNPNIVTSTPPTTTPTTTPPSTTPPTAQNATITGRILDVNNMPIPVVEIQIMNVNNASTQSVLSLEDGTYNLQNLENDQYQIKIRKTNYNIQEKTIEIKNNIVLDFLLELQPVPIDTFQVMGVICKKLPKLPNPILDASYI